MDEATGEFQVPPRRVIIESPWRARGMARGEALDEFNENKEYLRLCLADSIRRGEAPFASHGLYPGPLDEFLPEERTRGIALGYAWWPVAEFVAFYIDRGLSPGMKAALDRAHQTSMVYCFRSLEGPHRLREFANWTGGVLPAEPGPSSLAKAVEYLEDPEHG